MVQANVTSIARKGYRRLRQLLQPRQADLTLPAYFENDADLVLTTAQGRDNIALKLARLGWHGFEAPVPDVIAACVQHCGGAFFDIGANTGFYSLLAARSSATSQIHAFEPYARARRILLANIRRNKLESRIRVVEDALSDHIGTRNLYVPLQQHGSIESSCSLNAEFKPEHATVLKVRVTTIDDYMHTAGVDRLGLLKIDVESTEHLVVAGGTEVIIRDRPVIVLEVLHLADPGWLNRFCRDNRYRVFTLHRNAIQERDHIAFDNTAWNQCLCPEEKLEILERCGQTIGLDIGLKTTVP